MVIEYGRRWRGGSPPEESYSVSTHPERFAPLHAVAEALIEYLLGRYDASSREDLAVTADLMTGRDDVTRAVRITPASEDAAPLTFVLHAMYIAQRNARIRVTAARPLLLRPSLAAIAALAFLVAACSGDGAPPVERPTAEATVMPGATTPADPVASAPVPPRPSPQPTATPEGPALVGDIVGWFTEARPSSEVEQRTLPPAPPSPFAPRARDSVEVVLYDVQTMTERSLGPGGFANFSPDGTRLAWVTGATPHRWDELRVLDLATGEERSLGRARSLRWVDDETIVVHEVGNERALVDVATGASRPAGDVHLGYAERPVEAAGYRLERVTVHEPYPFWRSTYRVTRLATGDSFEFDAYRAVLAPDATIFLATVPDPGTRLEPSEGPNVGHVTSNIFAIDPATRQATFVETAQPSYPNWPFDASATHVVWNDRACADDASTRLYDRRSGDLVQVDAGSFSGRLWPAAFTPDGLIASGTFGAKALIDPDRLESRVVLPSGFSEVFWSPDYRYAVVSTQLGHGGLCG